MGGRFPDWSFSRRRVFRSIHWCMRQCRLWGCLWQGMVWGKMALSMVNPEHCSVPYHGCCSRLGGAWANQNVRFFTDNEALVSVIKKQTSRDPHIMTLLCRMILTCLTFNINFMACHVPGRLNSLADSLSRGQLDAFHLLAPWADARPTDLPARCLTQHL